MPERVHIQGGAGPYEAAAIVAVIVERERAEGRRRSRSRRQNVPPAWVRAARRSPYVASPVVAEPGPWSP